MREGDKDKQPPPFLALAALWERLVGGWTVPAMLDSARKLSVTVCVDTRSGGSPERCSFSDDRFLEATQKLHVQTRESTDDTFAVALCKMGLEKKFLGPHQGEYIQGRSSRGRIFGK